MKKLFYLLLSLIFVVACNSEQEERDVVAQLVPYPNQLQRAEGVFDACGASVHYDHQLDEATKNIIEAFAQRLTLVSGVESTTAQGCAESGFVFVFDQTLEQEAYTLDIEPQCAKVRASSLRGFNYAIQTIKQLLPVEIYGTAQAKNLSWLIPALHIEDAPRFAYRGMHLDEARHFFGIDVVKRYLDIMEVHKLNKLHWHLTDDQGWRIEIKKYPELAQCASVREGTCVKKYFNEHDGVKYGEGMWYTQEQIREVVEYAASKGIDIIPEIDLPGHMVAALSVYPELGCTGGPYDVWTRWGISDDVLCAGNDKIYDFLEDILSEVCELFPYKYIHIGGDECPKVRWEECPKCQAKIKELGLKDHNGHTAEHYLQSYVMTRVAKFLETKGRKVVGWDEILEGEIAFDATIMSWRGSSGGIKAANKGLDAIMAPNNYFYLDYYQTHDIENEPYGIGGYLPVEWCYTYEPFVDGMSDEQKQHILGVQANLWTEYIADEDHLFYMLLPRLATLAEVQWCEPEVKNWERFYAATVNLCDIYETMGYNYADHILHVKGEVKADPENGCATVTLSTPNNATIYYTLDGSKPNKRSAVYTEPLVIDQTCLLRAVSYNKGIKPREYSQKFDFHKAIGKNVEFSHKTYKRYTPGYPEALLDGVRGPEIIKNNRWVAWSGGKVNITIDMEQTEPYSSVIVGSLINKPSSLFLPERVSVSVSDDGEAFTEVATQTYTQEEEYAPDRLLEYSLSFPETSKRYLRVTITPIAQLPQWHYKAGRGNAHIFVDEIIVR